MKIEPAETEFHLFQAIERVVPLHPYRFKVIHTWLDSNILVYVVIAIMETERGKVLEVETEKTKWFKLVEAAYRAGAWSSLPNDALVMYICK